MWTLVNGLGLSGVFCLLTAPAALFSDHLVIFFSVLAKFCICSTYAVIYQAGGTFSLVLALLCVTELTYNTRTLYIENVIAGELYPTPVRGVGVGFSSIIGDLGNVVMPYILHSARLYRMLPMLVMGIVCLLTSFTSLFLPETKDTPMPDTLEEAEQIGKVNVQTMKENLKTQLRVITCKQC